MRGQPVKEFDDVIIVDQRVGELDEGCKQLL